MPVPGASESEIAVRGPVSRTAAAVRTNRQLLARVVLAGFALATVSAVTARATDTDGTGDLVVYLQRAGSAIGPLRWPFVALVAVLAGLHYGATAVAARAASGLPLPLGETVLVQFAASAANRVTAAGLGGAAVNTRYFHRRGLPVAGAAGAVAALSLFSCVADLTVLAGLIVVGSHVGLAGTDGELSRLLDRLTAIPAFLGPAGLAAVAVTATAALTYLAWRGRHLMREFVQPAAALIRAPGRLTLLLSAAAATTLIQATAFATSVAVVPGADSHLSPGAILIGFLLGSAASNAIPSPGGIGSTEAALAAVLMAGGLNPSTAIEIVLIFRVITFWLPPLIGLIATRRLRTAGAL